MGMNVTSMVRSQEECRIMLGRFRILIRERVPQGMLRITTERLYGPGISLPSILSTSGIDARDGMARNAAVEYLAVYSSLADACAKVRDKLGGMSTKCKDGPESKSICVNND